MAWQTLKSVWPVLAVLAYLLVTCVLSVLATHRGVAIAVHDRIRESKALRQRYIESLKARQRKR